MYISASVVKQEPVIQIRNQDLLHNWAVISSLKNRQTWLKWACNIPIKQPKEKALRTYQHKSLEEREAAVIDKVTILSAKKHLGEMAI